MHIQASPLTKPPMTAIQPRPPAQLPTPLIGDKQLQQLADAIESDLTQGVECLNSLTGLPAIDEEGNKQYRRLQPREYKAVTEAMQFILDNEIATKSNAAGRITVIAQEERRTLALSEGPPLTTTGGRAIKTPAQQTEDDE